MTAPTINPARRDRQQLRLYARTCVLGARRPSARRSARPTGSRRANFAFRPRPSQQPVFAGFVAVDDDLLVTTAGPQRYASSSPQLLVFDRERGNLLWQRRAAYGFRHNAICVAAGRVYCIDALSRLALDRAKTAWRRSAETACLPAATAGPGRSHRPRVVEHTGRMSSAPFSTTPGSMTSCCRRAVPRATEPATRRPPAWWRTEGLTDACCGRTSRASIKARVCCTTTPVLTQGEAYSLLDGQPQLRPDPLTGEQVAWQFTRNYGCSTALASEHLLTFRSAAAGFYDLACDGGTGNLGGFKSGCTSNLIVADGVLAAPEYTRTCTCRYQNQTSLALVHDPAAEMWTFSGRTWSGSRVLRAGVNFGIRATAATIPGRSGWIGRAKAAFRPICRSR